METELDGISSILSDTDYGCPKQLLRKYHSMITAGLPLANFETSIPPSIDRSWGPESLTAIMSEALPEYFTGSTPNLLLGSRPANTLELAIYSITNRLTPSWQAFKLFEWFVEPSHRPLLNSLIEPKTKFATQFFYLFLNLTKHLSWNGSNLTEHVKMLLNRYGETKIIPERTVQSLLRFASQLGCMDLMHYLLAKSGNLDFDRLRSALFLAIQKQRPANAEFLLECYSRTAEDISGQHWISLLTKNLATCISGIYGVGPKVDELGLVFIKYGAEVDKPLSNGWKYLGFCALEWYAFRSPSLYDSICGRNTATEVPVAVSIGRAAHASKAEFAAFVKARCWTTQDLETALYTALECEGVGVLERLLESIVDPDCPALYTTPKIPEREGRFQDNILKTLISWRRRSNLDSLEEMCYSPHCSCQAFDIFGNNFTGDAAEILVCIAIYYGCDAAVLRLLEKTGVDCQLDNPRRMTCLFGDTSISTPLQAALRFSRISLATALWNMGCRFTSDLRHGKGAYELWLACKSSDISVRS